jgi:hypothetical protein
MSSGVVQVKGVPLPSLPLNAMKRSDNAKKKNKNGGSQERTTIIKTVNSRLLNH